MLLKNLVQSIIVILVQQKIIRHRSTCKVMIYDETYTLQREVHFGELMFTVVRGYMFKSMCDSIF